MARMTRRRFVLRASAGAVGGLLVAGPRSLGAVAATSGEPEALAAIVAIVAASRELQAGAADVAAVVAAVGERPGLAAALDGLTYPEPFVRVPRAGQITAIKSALDMEPPRRAVTPPPPRETIAAALGSAASVLTRCDRPPRLRLTLAEGVYV